MAEIQQENSEPKKKAPGKPFTKNDPRINKKGRPKSFDVMRNLAQEIAWEEQTSRDGAVTMTTIEAILRKWASSGNAQLQKQFVEVAFGKVPDKLEVTGKDGGPFNPYAALTDDQLKELARRVVDGSGDTQDG